MYVYIYIYPFAYSHTCTRPTRSRALLAGLRSGLLRCALLARLAKKNAPGCPQALLVRFSARLGAPDLDFARPRASGPRFSTVLASILRRFRDGFCELLFDRFCDRFLIDFDRNFDRFSNRFSFAKSNVFAFDRARAFSKKHRKTSTGAIKIEVRRQSSFRSATST